MCSTPCLFWGQTCKCNTIILSETEVKLQYPIINILWLSISMQIILMCIVIVVTSFQWNACMKIWKENEFENVHIEKCKGTTNMHQWCWLHPSRVSAINSYPLTNVQVHAHLAGHYFLGWIPLSCDSWVWPWRYKNKVLSAIVVPVSVVLMVPFQGSCFEYQLTYRHTFPTFVKITQGTRSLRRPIVRHAEDFRGRGCLVEDQEVGREKMLSCAVE